MQQKRQLRRSPQPLLHTRPLLHRHQRHHLRHRRRKPLPRRLFIRMMHQPRPQIAVVRRIALLQLLGLL